MKIKPLLIEAEIYKSYPTCITKINGVELDTPIYPMSRKELIVKKYTLNMLRVSQWTKERIEDEDYGVPNDFSLGNYVYDSRTGYPHYLRSSLPDNLLMQIVRPVSLADELLIQIGFRKTDEDEFTYKGSQFVLMKNEKGGYSDEYGIPINHLHKLQNHFKFLVNYMSVDYSNDYFMIKLNDLPELKIE